MSIEALAMAGADYTKCSINLEMWEEIPEYLRADQEDLKTTLIKTGIDDLVFKSENFAEHIVIMAKVVASTKTKTKTKTSKIQVSNEGRQIPTYRDEDVNYGKKPSILMQDEIPFVVTCIVTSLAMAGADYMECSSNLEMLEQTPEYLRADQDLQSTPVIKMRIDDLVFKSDNFEQIVVMAKAVASAKTKTSKIQ
ncbi:hypothetical protein ACH5RR_012359 [Cinchona calisaya]|uniref:Uncharacterized protein n=1 Tax=Cinchona calisaya TaxID=153742 RepID=A0ABD3A805_9GENT